MRLERTCEFWNSSFKQLVGHSHISFYTLIDSIRKDDTLVKTMILQDERGKYPRKRAKRNYVTLQKGLKNLYKGVVAAVNQQKNSFEVLDDVSVSKSFEIYIRIPIFCF